jgi:lipoprotein-anchoring transpeptidase ErfK/SrfK
MPDSVADEIPADMNADGKSEAREIRRHIEALSGVIPGREPERVIFVHVGRQKLDLVSDRQIVKSYPVSTSKYGTGNTSGSERTPLGIHAISEKVGAGAALGTVFRGRVPTGETVVMTSEQQVGRDLITSRILWLDGLEEGVNRGNGIDSKSRYIYIHGTPEEGLIGTPASHGCVRMLNSDVIDLFERVSEGDPVIILP